MLPQEESLDILTEFLIHFGYHKGKGIPIDAIRKLARIVITENVFAYENLFIENKNGTLVTSVFHKQAAEPYIVPFKSDHPRQIFKNVIDGALMRAVQYSSKPSAFHNERRRIKLMFLYNG
jgi:hypothetical protein